MSRKSTDVTHPANAATNLQQLLQLALQHLNEQKWAGAISLAGQAVALDLANGFAHMVLGVALAGAGRFEAALAPLEQSTRLAPRDARTHYNFAVSLQRAGQELRAMTAYRACLALDPYYADALWNYGETLRLREHFALALELLDRLAGLEGKKRPHAAHRMAVCCAHLGHGERADALFREQLAADDDPITHWEYALFLLRERRFAQAWQHYARRFGAGERIQLRPAASPGEPWEGEFDAGATLVVAGEQGAGDEILFAAFVPELIERSRAVGMNVVLMCRPELVRLFRASFPGVRVEAMPVKRAGVDNDTRHHHPLVPAGGRVWSTHVGDLPRWLPKPVPRAFLVPDPDDLRGARALLGMPQVGLAESADRPLRVGLVWSANPAVTHMNRVSRNVPSVLVNEWLKDVPGVHFHALMPAAHLERVAEVADLPLTDLSGFVTDFSRTAAAIQCMDIVVSVCTSTANLAGALGADLHVLLQHHADWRWADASTWFARVRIHQQERRGDWTACVASLAAALRTQERQRVVFKDHARDER